jgi:hypothetical protein
MDKPKLTPKDFFLYVGALVTLYWSAGALIALLFSIIDSVFKDQLQYYVDPYSGGIRFAIASLVIIFPICLILFSAIKLAAQREPEKLGLALRKWLFSLTIFVSGAALIGDLIAILNGFLGGELTSRFVYKVVSVFVVAIIGFWYCLLEVRVRSDRQIGVRKSFVVGTAVLVLISIIFGFVKMGSPNTIRKMRFDEQRVSDLQSIQWQIVNFWQQKEKMPKALSELLDSLSGFKIPVDPRTGEQYEYILSSGKTFNLCAAFELESKKTSVIVPEPVGIAGDVSIDNWEHKSGRVCFVRTIDPERYSPYTKIR